MTTENRAQPDFFIHSERENTLYCIALSYCDPRKLARLRDSTIYLQP